MADKEKLIELLGDMWQADSYEEIADHLIRNGVVFKDRYEDMEERIANQRLRAQYAEDFICRLCAECDWQDHDGIICMTKKCCSWFPRCGKFKLRSGWIPVTERLPQEDQPLGALCEVVQVLLEDNTVTVGYCNRGMQLWFYLPLRGTHFVGIGFGRIVAWMPLPDAPGGGEK